MHINAVKDEQNRIINYIGIVSDLTEHKLQEQRLSYLENYDALTDLPPIVFIIIINYINILFHSKTHCSNWRSFDSILTVSDL